MSRKIEIIIIDDDFQPINTVKGIINYDEISLIKEKIGLDALKVMIHKLNEELNKVSQNIVKFPEN